MLSQIRPALVALALFTLLTGVLYPFAFTLVAQLAFPSQANGSLITQNGQIVGSTLIGQPFTAPSPYNAAASSGSNLAPTNPALVDAVQARINALHAADPNNPAPIPVDLV